MKTSKIYSLNYRDFLKGLLIAVVSSAITVIQSSVDAGNLKFNWHAIGVTALSAGIAYLFKNLLTPAKIVTKAPKA